MSSRYRDISPQQKEQLGPELFTVSNATSDPNGNESNTTTGYISDDIATFQSQSSVVNAGMYSLEANVNSVPISSARFKYDMSSFLTTGKKYKISIDARHVGTGGRWVARFISNSLVNSGVAFSLSNTDTTFQTYSRKFVYDGVNSYFGARESNGSNDGGIYFDNISVREILVEEHKEILNIDSRRGAIYDRYGNTITNTDVEIVRDGEIYAEKYNGSSSKLAYSGIDLEGQTALSVCAFVNLAELKNHGFIGCWNSGGQYLLYGTSSSFSFAIGKSGVGDGFKTVNHNTTLYTNKWYFLCGTWDGANLKIYVDGVLVNTNTLALTTIPPITGLLNNIGVYDSLVYLNGKISQERIYIGVLTAEEISQLYTSTKQYYGK